MSELRGEKRPLVQQNSILEGIAAVLIDLEGVSTPNSYINVSVPATTAILMFCFVRDFSSFRS